MDRLDRPPRELAVQAFREMGGVHYGVAVFAELLSADAAMAG